MEENYPIEQEFLYNLVNDSVNTVYVCDYNTDELIYMNAAAKTMCKCPQENYQKKKCYQAIMGYEKPCSFCPKNKMSYDKYEEEYTVSPRDGKLYRTLGKRSRYHNQEIVTYYVSDETYMWENNRQLKRQQKRYQRQIDSMMELDDAALIAKGQHNLTRNRVVFYQAKQDGAVSIVENESYDHALELLINSAVQESQEYNLQVQLNREKLLEDFAVGDTDGNVEYQRVMPNGEMNWVNTRYSLFEEPKTGDVMIFLFSYEVTNRIIDRQIISKLSVMEYEALGLLDVKSHGYILRNIRTKLEGPTIIGRGNFDKRMLERLSLTLLPEEKEHVMEQFAVENIVARLEKESRFTITYTIRDDEKNIRYKKMHFCYLDESRATIMYCRADITEIHEKEQEQMRRLEEALANAQQASRAKTEFLSNMSHEIRTPMNAIIGMSLLAQDEKQNPPQTMDYLRKIDESSEYLLGILNDVLDMSRIEHGKIELKPRWFTPYEVFASCIPMLESAMRRKNIHFQYEKISRYHKVQYYIDFLRSQQIFMNIMNNAVKFTPEGGTITLQYENHTMNEHQCRDVFMVTDTGCGMSKEFLEKIFEPFEQEHNPLALQNQGTGLGLALVKNIINAMGGEITVESQLGVGTTFRIELVFEYRPLSEKESQKSSTISQTVLKGKRVLLVDDHPLNREIAGKILKRREMIVEEAVNGQEALEKVKRAEEAFYDGILMDIRMPVMNGLEAAKAIRAFQKNREIRTPIIAMTANAYEEDVQAAFDAGMDAHLAKPIDPNILYDTLMKYL